MAIEWILLWQAVQLPGSGSRSHKASACAWSADGRFLLTGWHGGMGLLTVHEVPTALPAPLIAISRRVTQKALCNIRRNTSPSMHVCMS